MLKNMHNYLIYLLIWNDYYLFLKAHFHSRKFSAERKICKMWLADTNFPSEKNFEVENF
jgi:hypothetical protein